jgi:hypothetical protein
MNKYELDKVLAEEDFYKLHLVTEVDTGCQCILKIVKAPSLYLKECEAEVTTFRERKNFPHKNLIPYKHAFYNRSEKEFGILAEFCPGIFVEQK